MEPADLAHNPILGRFTEAIRARLARWLEEISFAPGEALIREGEQARDLYVILEGVAGVERAGVHVGAAGPGAHVAELGLLTAHPRAAAVVATIPVRAARLTGQRFDALCAEAPDLGDPPGARARRRRERAAPAHDRLRGACCASARSRGAWTRRERDGRAAHGAHRDTRGERRRRVRPGRARGGGARVAAARVPGRGAGCRLRGSSPSRRTTGGPTGASHQRSAGAAGGRARGAPLRAGAHGPLPRASQRVLLGDMQAPLGEDLLGALRAAMRDLIARDVPIRRGVCGRRTRPPRTFAPRAGTTPSRCSPRRARRRRRWSPGRLHALRTVPPPPRTGIHRRGPPRRGGGLAHAARGGAAGPAEPAMGVDGEFRAERARRDDPVSTSAGWARWASRAWACSTARASTAAWRPSSGSPSEGFHEKRLGRIADEVAARPALRLVCVAGPSSSGKTTFIKRLSVQLQIAGSTPSGSRWTTTASTASAPCATPTGSTTTRPSKPWTSRLLTDHLGGCAGARR